MWVMVEVPAAEVVTVAKMLSLVALIVQQCHYGEKVFLFSTEVNQKIYASEFLKILRLKSDCINPEYLFLYLQSTVGQKYFKKHLKGSTIGMLSIEDLRKLPIILPSLEIQENSKSFLIT